MAAFGLLALTSTNGRAGPGLSAFDVALTEEFGWDRATLKLRDTVTYVPSALFMTAGVGTAVIFVSSWFPPRSRGAAFGLTIAGTSVGGIVFGQLNAALLERVGWREAFEIEAAIAAAFLVAAAVVVRAGAYRRGRGADGPGPEAGADGSLTFAEAVRTAPFWAIAASGGLTYFSIVGALTNLVLLAGDLGLELADGVNAISLLLLVALGSKLGAGLVADRVGPYRLFRACSAVMGAGLATLAPLQAPLLLAGAVVVGLGRAVYALRLRPPSRC